MPITNEILQLDGELNRNKHVYPARFHYSKGTGTSVGEYSEHLDVMIFIPLKLFIDNSIPIT